MSPGHYNVQPLLLSCLQPVQKHTEAAVAGLSHGDSIVYWNVDIEWIITDYVSLNSWEKKDLR